jgi:aspartyl-tRNA synthetase
VQTLMVAWLADYAYFDVDESTVSPVALHAAFVTALRNGTLDRKVLSHRIATVAEQFDMISTDVSPPLHTYHFRLEKRPRKPGLPS